MYVKKLKRYLKPFVFLLHNLVQVQKGHRKWGDLTQNFWGKLALGAIYPVSTLEPPSE